MSSLPTGEVDSNSIFFPTNLTFYTGSAQDSSQISMALSPVIFTLQQPKKKIQKRSCQINLHILISSYQPVFYFQNPDTFM